MAKRISTLLAAIALLAIGALCGGAEPIHIADGWVRATPPGVTSAAAYFTIKHPGPEDRLVGATSPQAREIQLHASIDEAGVATMRRQAEIRLPAGADVELAPGGLHLMLLDIVTALAPGDAVSITLHFAMAGDIDVSLPVLDGRAPQHHMH